MMSIRLLRFPLSSCAFALLLACNSEEGGAAELPSVDDASVVIDEDDAGQDGGRDRVRDRLAHELDGAAEPDARLPEAGAADASGSDASVVAPPASEGLALWLRADRGVNQLEGAVTIWEDQSPSRAHAAQLTAAHRPRFVPAANGLPAALAFDGVDDALTLPAGFADFSAGMTLFALAQVKAGEGCAPLLELSNGTEVDDIHLGRFRSHVLFEVLDSPNLDAPFPADRWVQLSVVQTALQQVRIRTDGETRAEPSTPAPKLATRSLNFVGKSLYADCPPLSGRLAELLVYRRALSDAELLAVEAHLRQRLAK